MGTPRLGIMGGTFDPVHIGHLVTADEALSRFALDKVVFMPTGDPVAKSHVGVSPAYERLRMTEAAVAGDPRFEVSTMEIDRDGPTYTVDTLEQMSQRHPGVDLFFITGADAVLEILTWKEPERVAELATLIAATRPGYDLDTFTSSAEGRRFGDRVEVMENPAISISSTEIRDRVAQGRPYRYWVPEPVARIIDESGLYSGARDE